MEALPRKLVLNAFHMFIAVTIGTQVSQALLGAAVAMEGHSVLAGVAAELFQAQ